MNRYARQIRLKEIGENGQRLIARSSVLIVGCGGLGSPVAMYLAAAGVGTVGLVDSDKVDLTNLQRQILFKENNVGVNKAEQAYLNLKELNSAIKYKVYSEALSAENALDIVKEYDIVVDGTDNFAAKYLINDACFITQKPWVYGAIHRFEGQVAVFNHTSGITYRDMYSVPPPADQAPNCAEEGVMGMVAGLIGSYQALEVIKLLTGQSNDLLDGKMLIVDTLSMEHLKLKLQKNPEIKPITSLIDYESFCASSFEIRPEVLKTSNMLEYQIIDVRELDEVINTPFTLPHTHITLGEINEQIHQLDTAKKVVFVCASGIRSAKAVKLVQKTEYKGTVLSLSGGIKAWFA